jgi:5-methylcytosine-specific restriction endonuclease McrA
MDSQARLACLMAAGGSCAKCGASGIVLEHHHVITRRVRALRWLPENALALCHPCHAAWHAHPKAALEWFVERYGEARLAYLRSMRS